MYALLAAGANIDAKNNVSIMGDIGGMTTVPCMFAWWWSDVINCWLLLLSVVVEVTAAECLVVRGRKIPLLACMVW